MSTTRAVALLTGAAAVAVAAAVPGPAAIGATRRADVAGASTGSSAVAFAPKADLLQGRKPARPQWWYDAMGLAEIHRTATGKGVKVAVIDTGLDTSVPELQGADISFGEECSGGRTSKPLTGMPSDHGTAMTAAIVGQGNGGVLGVAPDAQVRFWSIDTDPSNDLFECDSVLIAKQMVKAVDWGADVISMSLGAGSQIEPRDYARSKGAVVVMAGGKKVESFTPLALPAGDPGSFAVLAANEKGQSWRLNPVSIPGEGSFPTIAAPGIETELGGVVEGRGWVPAARRTGTSGATAITAGAFAVLKSRWPEATGNQLVQTVIHHTSGSEDGELRLYDNAGYGRLSLRNAIAVDPTGYPDEDPLALVSPRKVMATYPGSVYQEPGTSGTAAGGDQADQADEADEGGQDDGDSADASAGASTGSDTTDSGGGVPVPLLVGLGALLLLVAGAALAWSRRRTSTQDDSPTSSTTDTTPATSAPRGN